MSYYIISFETADASFTVRFRAETDDRAAIRAKAYIDAVSDGGPVFITEELTINRNA